MGTLCGPGVDSARKGCFLAGPQSGRRVFRERALHRALFLGGCLY